MRNLAPYNEDCFEFHKNVLKSKNNTKKDPTYKERVESLHEEVKPQFVLYDSHFGSDSLPLLTNKAFDVQSIDDLRKLYSYDLSLIQKLKIKVTTDTTRRVISTCQNCTINQVNSFDHIVPQTEFPEFSVNPKNLFPSCTECNSKKSKIWRKDGKRTFLNLYLDELPQVQYLFVSISFEDNVPIAKFKVENKNGIDDNLFEIIKNHYDKLSLCERFAAAIDETVINTINDINSGLRYVPLDEFRKVYIEDQTKLFMAFGFNFWKTILQLELVNNDQFISYAQSMSDTKTDEI